MQLRWQTSLTGEDYVALQGWSTATPIGCPWHPEGGCRFKRHGTYSRVRPEGCLIARYYCPLARRTVSLLPDCLAAHRTGTLERIEAEVLGVERAGSLWRAATTQRPEVALPGALRWLDRACRDVHGALATVRLLLPERFEHTAPTIGHFALALGLSDPAAVSPAPPTSSTASVPGVLRALRAALPNALGSIGAPLGFDPRRRRAGRAGSQRQHRAGADPPPGSPEDRALTSTRDDPCR